MSIEHTIVQPGDGMYAVTKRLINDNVFWGKLTQAQKDGYAGKLAASNGFKGVGTAIVVGQVLHYKTEDFAIPVITPPPTVRVPKPIPFTNTSPFNTTIPTGAQWQTVPILNNISVPVNGDTQRYWYGGEGQLVVCRGIATDPLWTITMPEFGNDDARFNRHWMPATWKMHLPAVGPVVGGNDDSILCLLDETTGDYADIGNGAAYVIDRTNYTIIGTAGAWWARGNVDTGTGVGGLLSAGGNSAGVRAANFAWMAGAITAYDVDQVLTGKKTDFGHALALMLGLETLSMWGVSPPATAPNNGNNNGPINMGARIGIPAGVAKPAGFGTDLLNVAYWNTLQKYGALVGDYAGGPWPIFQIDLGSVAKSALDSMWVWWAGNPANKYVIPTLRVMI